MRILKKGLLWMLALVALCLPLTAWGADAPKRVKLDGVNIALIAPSDHAWVNKSMDLGLMVAPSKYQGVIKHLVSLYSYTKTRKKPSRPYNNYCAIIYMGPESKVWTPRDFAELRLNLMPGRGPAREHPDAVAYMLALVREGAGYNLPDRKGEKYFDMVQGARIISNNPEDVILSLRLKKKDEKEKHVVLSLALMKGKVIGTLYYQVSADGDERNRAIDTTRAWQQALLAANR